VQLRQRQVLAALVAVAAVVSPAWSWQAGGTNRAAAEHGAGIAAASWPQDGYSAGHAFFNPDQGRLQASGLAAFRQLWRFHARNPIVSDITVAGGRVFAGSGEWRVSQYGGIPGAVYGLDARTGRLQWRYPLPGNQILSAPSYYQNRLYVATSCMDIQCVQNRVVALSPQSGKVLWRFRPRLNCGGYDTTAADGLIYAQDGRFLYALGAKTGHRVWARDTGKLPWLAHHGLPCAGGLDGAPAVAGSLAIFSREVCCTTGVSTAATFEAVDARTGRLRWRWTTHTQFGGGGDTALVGAKAFLAYSIWNGWAVTAVVARTGHRLWTHRFSFTTFGVSTAAAVDGSIIVAVDDNGGIYGVSPLNGDLQWFAKYRTSSWPPCESMFSGPIIAGGVIFVGGRGQCGLFAFDAATGVRLWSSGRGRANFDQTAAFAGGRLYAGTSQGDVYAFGPPGRR
jgi:outer membrane protein assembly factor BamB